MNVSVVIATCGEEYWSDLAQEALASALFQSGLDPGNIHQRHYSDETSVSRARNTLAADATGDWLCFLDADDVLEPGYIDAMAVAAAQRDGLALLVPYARYVEIDGTVGVPSLPPGNWPVTNIAVIGTLIPRGLFFDLGGFREFASIEDYDLWLRAFDAGAELIPVPDAIYRVHRAEHSRNLDQSPYQAIWADHIERTRDT